ncbi:hypothetical protein DFH09DRAFT_1319764 [Mycena vulgaris]|nr:hypothetical protein DFH09DRAFT_1319764 [Mycena vulgaris]
MAPLHRLYSMSSPSPSSRVTPISTRIALPFLPPSSAHLTRASHPPVSLFIIARLPCVHLLSTCMFPCCIHVPVPPRSVLPTSPHLNHPGVLSLHTPPLHSLPPLFLIRPRPSPLALALALALALSSSSYRTISLSSLPPLRPSALSTLCPPLRPVSVSVSKSPVAIPPAAVPFLCISGHHPPPPPPPLRAPLPILSHPSALVRARRIHTALFSDRHIQVQGPRIPYTHMLAPARDCVVRSSGSGSNLNPDSKSLLLKSAHIQIHTPAAANPSLDSLRLATPTLTRITFQMPILHSQVQVRVPSPRAPKSTSQTFSNRHARTGKLKSRPTRIVSDEHER